MAIKRDKVVKTAEKYVSRGKIEAAIKEYQKLLKDQPNDVNTLNRIGDLYTRLDKDEEAIRFFKQIAEQYTRDGFFVKAIAIYKKIIRIDPGRLAVYEQLADLYAKQGLMNEARAQFQVLVDHYLKNNDDAAAINVYQKLVDLEPENPSHHLKLGELYQKRQLFDQAQGEYDKIAELMLEHGRGEEAARVYERAVEMEPEDLAYVSSAVLSLKDAGFVAPAAKLLARAVELNPEAERIQRQLGPVEPEPEPAAPVPPPPEPTPTPFEIGELEEEEVLEIEEEGIDLGGLGDVGDLGDLGVEPSIETASVAPEPVADEDAGFLEIDFDEDDSAGMVLPPPDMDSPGTAFQVDEPVLEEEIEPEAEIGGIEPELEEASFELEEISLEMEEEIELDLGAAVDLEEPADIDWEAEPVAEAPGIPEPEPESELGAEPEPEPEPEPAEVASAEDLLAEAEVFAKYGLGGKALERLEQVLAIEPEHLEALRRRVEMTLDHGEPDRVATAVETYRAVARARGETPDWGDLAPQLAELGIELADVEAELEIEAVELEESAELELETAEPEEPAEIEVEEAPEVADLEVEPPPAARPGRRVADVDRALEELTSEILKPKRAAPKAKAPPAPAVEVEEPAAAEFPEAREPGEEPAAGEPPEAAEPAEAAEAEEEVVLAEHERVHLEDDFESELPDIKLPEESLVSTSINPLEESGMHWLEETTPPAAAASGDEILFDDEEDFFDLAAELEQELSQEEARLGPDVVQPEEPSLEEIVEGFKRGVAENLSQEDFATHYNLGIAYREMGLLDEAIGEFQLASKSPELRVDCCSMLGITFLEKGLPELAVKWYQKGLETDGLKEETRLGLLYDMAAVHGSMGDDDAARTLFTEIYGTNSQFRDVGEKLEELRSRA